MPKDTIKVMVLLTMELEHPISDLADKIADRVAKMQGMVDGKLHAFIIKEADINISLDEVPVGIMITPAGVVYEPKDL